MNRRRAALLVSVMLCGPAAAADAPGVEGLRHINADGYREAYYMAATPDFVPGGERIGTAALRTLLAEDPGVVLIDVLSMQEHILPDLERGWIPGEPRKHLPGSVWLPNVGHGWIDDEIRDWFRTNLRWLTEGQRDRAVVFYCLTDCWMAWNATRRASRLGYTRLYWYADGADGWAEAGLPTVLAEPVPLRGAVPHGEPDG